MQLSVITNDPAIEPIVQDLYHLSQQNPYLPRWVAGLSYYDGETTTSYAFFIEDLSELQDIVDDGPDLNTLTKIVVKLVRHSDVN